MYIVIEGQDATGKNSQAELLADYLRNQGKKVVIYSDSGTGSDDKFVQEISRLNYQSDQGALKMSHVLMYLINRYEQWHKLAEPTLKAGGVVIATRNWFSTLIYEGYGIGVSHETIKRLHQEVMPERYFHPDKIVFLTLPENVQLERMKKQERNEIWKAKGVSFQRKLNHGYAEVAKMYKIPVLDASGTIEEVFEKIKQLFKI